MTTTPVRFDVCLACKLDMHQESVTEPGFCYCCGKEMFHV